MWYFIGGFVLGFAVGAWSLAIALIKKQKKEQASNEASLG